MNTNDPNALQNTSIQAPLKHSFAPIDFKHQKDVQVELTVECKFLQSENNYWLCSKFSINSFCFYTVYNSRIELKDLKQQTKQSFENLSNPDTLKEILEIKDMQPFYEELAQKVDLSTPTTPSVFSSSIKVEGKSISNLQPIFT